MAGMIDILQGLGQQLLLSGNETYSTPFLSCPLSYMHPNLVNAFASVARIGRDIQRGELPHNLPPLVFAFTGKGNVIRGATQVFEKLPVQWLSNKDELKQVVLSKCNKLGHRCVYGYMVKPEDIYVLKKEKHKRISSVFNKSHYRSNPHEYTSVFGRDIAPFINVLVNGAYWDERYPRILTKEDIRMLYEQGNTSLIAIADISCDINGSIEFLDKTTSIDHPFFHYNPLNGMISDHFETSGRFHKNNDKTISVMGVDILPAELARESSEHFGNALLPLLTKITMGSSPDNNIALTLPPELELACIAEGGQLKPRYGYLATFLMRTATTAEEPPFTRRDHPPTDSANGLLKYSSLISLEGHLFDSGLINRALDIIESYNGCSYEIRECLVGQKENKKSSVLIRLNSNERELLTTIIPNKIEALAQLIVCSQASVKAYFYDKGELQLQNGATVRSECTQTDQNVLILGAGRVSASVAEYMGRTPGRNVIVAGELEHDVSAIARLAKRGKGVVLDVTTNKTGLSSLVKNADIVVSLLPASMHPIILEECLKANKNMVTASYASYCNDSNFQNKCKQAGIIVLNEMGLDPGIDHMSAMKVIESMRDRGGKIKSFVSVCGGLPSSASSGAEDHSLNPLRYKFSWSPLGVIKACGNPATYRQDKRTVFISGSDLLNAAFPVKIWPDLSYGLECIPNRDSLHYGDLYGISKDSDTIFRGTLRYRGFSEIMQSLKQSGLFDDLKPESHKWGEQLERMVSRNGCSSLSDYLALSTTDSEKVTQVANFLNWLGLVSSEEPLARPESILLSFCQVLEKRLYYGSGEHDMVLMHHDIWGAFEDGSIEIVHSNLKLIGDDNMSAMCKTVGYTAAIGADLILNRKITQKGVITPFDFSALQRNEILGLLQEEGIKFEETLLLKSASTFPLPNLV